MRAILGLLLGLTVVGCGATRANHAPGDEHHHHGHHGHHGHHAQACDEHGHPGPGAHGECPAHAMGAETCPLAVEGTSVRAEDVEGGAAVVFTTSGDVVELRNRVAAMAERHDAHAESAGESVCPCVMAGSMPAHATRVEEVEGGARLVLIASSPEDVGALRARVREHGSHMSSGTCPMHGGPGGQP